MPRPSGAYWVSAERARGGQSYLAAGGADDAAPGHLGVVELRPVDLVARQLEAPSLAVGAGGRVRDRREEDLPPRSLGERDRDLGRRGLEAGISEAWRGDPGRHVGEEWGALRDQVLHERRHERGSRNRGRRSRGCAREGEHDNDECAGQCAAHVPSDSARAGCGGRIARVNISWRRAVGSGQVVRPTMGYVTDIATRREALDLRPSAGRRYTQAGDRSGERISPRKSDRAGAE